jgi:hypothetical protein
VAAARQGRAAWHGDVAATLVVLVPLVVLGNVAAALTVPALVPPPAGFRYLLPALVVPLATLPSWAPALLPAAARRWAGWRRWGAAATVAVTVAVVAGGVGAGVAAGAPRPRLPDAACADAALAQAGAHWGVADYWMAKVLTAQLHGVRVAAVGPGLQPVVWISDAAWSRRGAYDVAIDYVTPRAASVVDPAALAAAGPARSVVTCGALVLHLYGPGGLHVPVAPP